jgi:hypothetical protein
MKINMKKLAAWMLALLLVLQMIPAMSFAAEAKVTIVSNVLEFDEDDYRDKLKITSDTSIVQAGDSIQILAPSDYTVTWESNNEEIATVDENGLVTGHAEGRVKITAKESGQDATYADSLLLKIVGTEVAASENVVIDDNSQDEPADNTEEKTKVIVININKKDKETYNGQPHAIGFTAEGNFDGFDQSKVQITDEELLLTGKDCGTYQTKFENSNENYFTYDGETEGYEFIVSDGWMKVIPAEVTVTADDKTALPGTNPEFTVTVSGLVEGDDASLIKCEFITQKENGVTYIIPDGAGIQSNYKITYRPGVLNNGYTSPLYNIAQIGNSYYRLRKTEINTLIPIGEYVKNFKVVGNAKILQSEEYQAEPYDFDNEIIEYNKKKYAYISRMGENLDVDGYYTAEPKTAEFLTAVYQKIGGTAGDLVPSAKYNDSNATDSFHRNYIIKVSNIKAEKTEVQPLYNFLNINNNYYRLKQTTINARPVSEVVEKNEFGTQKPEQHILKCDPEEYDFTNVVLNIDGKKYVYRDKSYLKNLPEHYVSFYTLDDKVEIVVPVAHKLNKDDKWYNDINGWVDTDPWGVDNNIDAYHRDYKATLHEGNIPYYTISFQGTDEAIESINEAEGTTVELPVLEKDGSNFRGWSLVENPEEDTDVVTSVTLAGDITLYPVWENAIDETNLGVILHSNLEGLTEVEAGTEVVLTAEPVGFTGLKYTIEWEYEKPDGTFVKIEGADSLIYKFRIDSENAQYVYHVILTPTGLEE